MAIIPSGVIYLALTWIATTGVVKMPPQELMSEEHLPEIHIGGDDLLLANMKRCFLERGVILPTEGEMIEHAKSLEGFYCENWITLREKEELFRGAENMVSLIHELVHWIQHQNGDWDPNRRCVAYLEWDAYQVQHIWQEDNGIPPFPGEFTAWARSQCSDRLGRDMREGK